MYNRCLFYAVFFSLKLVVYTEVLIYSLLFLQGLFPFVSTNLWPTVTLLMHSLWHKIDVIISILKSNLMLWDQYSKILMIEIVSCKWNINGVAIGQGLVLTKWNKPSKNEGSTIYCPLLLKKCDMNGSVALWKRKWCQKYSKRNIHPSI